MIATRLRRGPALAPSRGSGGMLPREILKIAMRRYAFFTILGYNFRKIRERICKVICTYIYNFYKIFEVTGKIRKIKKKDVQHEENHASNGRPSNILRGCLCPYVVTTSKSKCMSLWTYRRSSAFKRPSDIVLRWSDLTNPRANFFFFFFFFFFFLAGTGARVPAPPPPWIRYWWSRDQFEIPFCHQATSCPRVTSWSILPGYLSRNRRRTDKKDFYHAPQHHKPEHIYEIHFPPSFPFKIKIKQY